jgi:hypothetical protein
VNVFGSNLLGVLLVAVVSMVRGDMRPGTYAITLAAALVALSLGLWFLATWLSA